MSAVPGVNSIDWVRVNKNLRCPMCGDKAKIEAESDGYGGYHIHRFKITREMALKLSRPSDEEKEELLEKARKLVAETGISWTELETKWRDSSNDYR